MALFGRKNERIAGIEIDTLEIRAVVLEKQGRQLKLIGAGKTTLPENAVLDGFIQNHEALVMALKRLWNSADLGTHRVVLGIANQGVVIRSAAITRVPPEKVAQTIRYQAQEFLPMSINDAVISHVVLGEKQGPEGPMLDLLLIAAKKDMVNSYITALTGAGLKAAGVTVTPLTVAEIVTEKSEQEAIAVINISNGTTSVTVKAGGVPRFARIIPLGLKDAIAEPWGSIDALLTGAGIDDVPSGWLGSLVNDIRSSLTYYQAQNFSNNLENLVLAGKGARLKGLSEYLHDQLGFNIEIMNPLAKISEVRADIRNEAPDYAACVGLALSGLEG